MTQSEYALCVSKHLRPWKMRYQASKVSRFMPEVVSDLTHENEYTLFGLNTYIGGHVDIENQTYVL